LYLLTLSRTYWRSHAYC